MTKSMTMPGFAAESSLGRARGRYRNAAVGASTTTTPGFIPQALPVWVCGAVLVAIIGGQEELIPLYLRECFDPTN